MIIDKIKVMKSNSFYRFSDLVFQLGLKWKEDRKVILTSPEYKGSLLRDYLEKLDDPYCGSFEEDIFIKNIEEHIIKNSIKVNENSLLIHLRTGDYIGWLNRYCCQGKGLDSDRQERLLEKIHDYISLNNINKILFVTAMHFGDFVLSSGSFASSFSEHALKENEKLLLSLFNEISNEFKLPLDVFPSRQCYIENVDYHFLSLINASHAILDNRGFGVLIDRIRCARNG
jgi:hypothetical protein